MGCCQTNTERLSRQNPYKTGEFMNNHKEKKCLNGEGFDHVSETLTVIDNITMNLLGQALWLGNFHAFKNLIEEKGAKVEIMEKIFEKQGKSGIEILIFKNFFDMFKYYLPIFLVSFSKKVNNFDYFTKPLIVQAIESESLEIIQHIYSYFVFVNPPATFDFYYVNPFTGENSALVACRTLNLPIIRFLNEVCQVDFSVINFKKQTALHIAVKANKKNSNYAVIEYLIENCEFDIRYNYENLLMSVCELETLKLVENKLDLLGISDTRENVMNRLGEKKKQANYEENL